MVYEDETLMLGEIGVVKLVILVATLIGFVLGTLMGALAAWPKAPRFVRGSVLPLMTMLAVPPYLLGLVVLYILGLTFQLFPLSGLPGYHRPDSGRAAHAGSTGGAPNR